MWLRFILKCWSHVTAVPHCTRWQIQGWSSCPKWRLTFPSFVHDVCLIHTLDSAYLLHLWSEWAQCSYSQLHLMSAINLTDSFHANTFHNHVCSFVRKSFLVFCSIAAFSNTFSLFTESFLHSDRCKTQKYKSGLSNRLNRPCQYQSVYPPLAPYGLWQKHLSHWCSSQWWRPQHLQSAMQN